MTLSSEEISKWDKRFLELATLVSTWSKDPSTKAGAVIVRPNNTVASVGFNGFPMHMEDKEEWLENRAEKYSRVVHCEMNALIFCREPTEGYTLYTVPFCSCDRCFVHMVQAGIVRFVFPTPSEDKLERWGEAFRRVEEYAYQTGVDLCQLDF